MDTLRHLLSFTYDRGSDKYVPIKIWVNPNDENDFLVMTRLAGRHAREKLYNELVSDCDIVVGPSGSCERDAVHAVTEMYANYGAAMRTDYSAERPAQPVLYLDATGCALGRGITHVEAGSADFAGGAKQSRSTLAPLALYEGSDSGAPLRAHLQLVFPSWNRLCRTAELDIGGKCQPCQPITSADMQGALHSP